MGRYVVDVLVKAGEKVPRGKILAVERWHQGDSLDGSCLGYKVTMLRRRP